MYGISTSALNSDLWVSYVIPILLINITIEYSIKNASKLLAPQLTNGTIVEALQITSMTVVNCFKTVSYTHLDVYKRQIPWCPGELHDGQYGHYDLNCTIYLTGYDRYADPETEAPNGADGGTGNLEALAASSNDGTLTRTVIKQDQYGNAYAGNAVTARFTKTIALPPGAAGFKGWYENGADTYGLSLIHI